jgi:hypothetical protein
MIAWASVRFGFDAINSTAAAWGTFDGIWSALRALGILQGLWEGPRQGRVPLSQLLTPARIRDHVLPALTDPTHRTWASGVIDNYEKELANGFPNQTVEQAAKHIQELRNLVHGAGAQGTRPRNAPPRHVASTRPSHPQHPTRLRHGKPVVDRAAVRPAHVVSSRPRPLGALAPPLPTAGTGGVPNSGNAQRTLDPRVRGSSPWRRTHDQGSELVFLPGSELSHVYCGRSWARGVLWSQRTGSSLGGQDGLTGMSNPDGAPAATRHTARKCRSPQAAYVPGCALDHACPTDVKVAMNSARDIAQTMASTMSQGWVRRR